MLELAVKRKIMLALLLIRCERLMRIMSWGSGAVVLAESVPPSVGSTVIRKW